MAALARPTARSVQTLCARLLRSGRPASATSYPRLSTRSATTPLASLARPQRNNTRSLALAPLRSSSTDTAEASQRAVEPAAWDIKMLYDGDCPLCVREVSISEPLSHFAAFALALQ